MSDGPMMKEIEVKAVLNHEQYDRLRTRLQKDAEPLNEETIVSTRFRPGDVRLRKSEKTREVIAKSGDPMTISRQEVTLPLKSDADLKTMGTIFTMIGLTIDPPWTKHKHEFTLNHKGHTYTLCLQHIEDFARILEVEYVGSDGDEKLHVANIHEIIHDLDLEPIDPSVFAEQIKEYVESKGDEK